MKRIILPIAISIFVFLTLSLTLAGRQGNPKIEDLNSNLLWSGENSIFDNSSPRARFALTYSLVEDKSFQLSLPLAHFSTPDLAISGTNYVSLFPAGVSLIVIPGYVLGRYFDLSQAGTFATISLFAFFNFIFIYLITKRLGHKKIPALLAGMIFLFATPAFAYASIMYQHHITVFVLLASIYFSIVLSTYWATFLFLFLSGFSMLIDYPNAILMAPIGFYLLHKIIKIKKDKSKISLSLNPWIITSLLALIIPLGIMGWVSYKSYGNPLQLAGTLKRVKHISADGTPAYENYINIENNTKLTTQDLSSDKQAIGFFNTRQLLNGLYTHLFSQDRGVLYYSPIIMVGLMYALFTIKQFTPETKAILSIIIINLLLYSLWGDPWGGWAFGSRYLIPAYALASILIGRSLALTAPKKIFTSILLITMAYSIAVNGLGALTTTNIPPKVEVLGLEKVSGREEKYTYIRNWNYIKNNQIRPILFGSWLQNKMTADYYYYSIVALIISVSSGLFFIIYKKRNE